MSYIVEYSSGCINVIRFASQEVVSKIASNPTNLFPDTVELQEGRNGTSYFIGKSEAGGSMYLPCPHKYDVMVATDSLISSTIQLISFNSESSHMDFVHVSEINSVT